MSDLISPKNKETQKETHYQKAISFIQDYFSKEYQCSFKQEGQTFLMNLNLASILSKIRLKSKNISGNELAQYFDQIMTMWTFQHNKSHKSYLNASLRFYKSMFSSLFENPIFSNFSQFEAQVNKQFISQVQYIWTKFQNQSTLMVKIMLDYNNLQKNLQIVISCLHELVIIIYFQHRQCQYSKNRKQKSSGVFQPQQNISTSEQSMSIQSQQQPKEYQHNIRVLSGDIIEKQLQPMIISREDERCQRRVQLFTVKVSGTILHTAGSNREQNKSEQLVDEQMIKKLKSAYYRRSKSSKSIESSGTSESSADQESFLKKQVQNMYDQRNKIRHKNIGDFLIKHNGQLSQVLYGYKYDKLLTQYCSPQKLFKNNYFKRVVKLFEEISDALFFLQKIKFIHCDIKPSNIMVTQGQKRIAKIIDIGGLTNTQKGQIDFQYRKQLSTQDYCYSLNQSYLNHINFDMYGFGRVVEKVFCKYEKKIAEKDLNTLYLENLSKIKLLCEDCKRDPFYIEYQFDYIRNRFRSMRGIEKNGINI